MGANRDIGNSGKKQHVLTEKEASSLLIESADYLSTSGDHVDGRHRTEVVAKKMESDGNFDLADTLMGIHNTFKEFASGDNKSLRYFSDDPMHDRLVEEVKNTGFEKSIEKTVATLASITETFADREIDWDKSAEVIAKVKRERFPEMLTMVEKLTDWQRDQSRKGHSKT